MKAIPPWQPSTASTYGAVVNGGKIYVLSVSGTSAGYVFTVTSANATVGATYTNNAVTFTVLATIAGATTLVCSASGPPAASGTLAKASGSGDATITFSTFTNAPGPTQTNTNSTADGSAQWLYAGTNAVTSDPGLSQPAWIASTAYSLPQQVIANGNVYALTVAGTSTTGSGPSTTSNQITDGTAVWTYLGVYALSPYVGNFPTYTYGTSTSLANPFSLASDVNLSAKRVRVVAGGTGYAVGDTIPLAGGTSTITIVLTVTAVNSGAVMAASVLTAGVYTVPITDPAGQASTSGSGTGATFAVAWSQPSFCRLRGCYNGGVYTTNPGPFSRLYTFQSAAGEDGSTMQFHHCAVEFMTDAPKIGFNLANGSSNNFTVVIDGVRYSVVGMTPNTGATTNWHQFDFGTTTGRRVRHWRIEFMSAPTGFGSINVDTGSLVWAPNDNDKVTMVIDADSIVAGALPGPYLIGNCIDFRMGHELGWSDVWSFTQGGTGYCNRGTGPGVTSDTYGYRLTEALLVNPDIWVFFGSTNDIGTSPATVTATVAADLQAIRAAGSTAPIVVFGLWSINNGGLAAVEAAIAAGVVAASDPLGLTFFLPLYNRPTFPVLNGAYNCEPAPSGLNSTTQSNFSSYLFAGDSIHPVDLGWSYLAEVMINDIKTLVLPNLSGQSAVVFPVSF